MGRFVGSTAPFGPAHPVVGRERERGLLRAALASALGGHGGLALLAGEAGIGKTALARDFAREAREQGAMVLVGRAYDLGEPPPYGVWLDLLGPELPEEGADTLAATRAALRPAAGTSAGTRQAMFERAFAGFARLAGERSLVCLLDDLHWADPDSLDLLRFVARQLAAFPFLLVGTYRADELAEWHPLARLLPALVREAEPLRIALAPLDEAAIRALVQTEYALPPGEEARLLAYLRARAAGNPLYLGELLRTLEDEQLLRQGDGEGSALGDLTGLRVPPLLRQVIAERLNRLGAEANRLLTAAALIGHEVPLALWSAVAEAPQDELLALAERATAARVLDATTDGLRVQFHHPLIREALYDSLAPLRRRVVHGRIGDLLAAAPQPDPDAVADHFRRAAEPRAVEWLLRASDRAHRAYAWLAAAERDEAALAILEQHDADPGERGWLCIRLARLRRMGDQRRALAYAERAFALAGESGDRSLAAYAQNQVALLRCRIGQLREGLADMAASFDAQEALPPDDLARLAARRAALGGQGPVQSRCTLALWLMIPGRYGEAIALAERLIADAAAEEGIDRAISAFVLAVAAANLGHPTTSARWFAEAHALNRAAGEHWQVGQFSFMELLNLQLPYRAERPDECAHLVAEAEAGWRLAAGAVRADVPPGLPRLPLLALAGEWDAAWDSALATRAGGGMNVPNVLALLGPLALARGEVALARELVRETLPAGQETAPGDCWFRTGVALQRMAASLELDAGNLAEARAWLAAHDRWLAWSGAVLGRAEGHLGWAAYHRAAGDLAVARRHADVALAHATEPRQPLALLAARRTLGELDTAAGRHAEAAAHLDAALGLADACAAPYERALTLLVLAELHWAAGRVPEVRAAFADARATFERLGAAPALARADRFAAKLALVRPRSAHPDGLTEREVEVLRLVADGRSNREIAAVLSVSGRTVERHLENSYRKIGARNRAEATAYAFRHDLT